MKKIFMKKAFLFLPIICFIISGCPNPDSVPLQYVPSYEKKPIALLSGQLYRSRTLSVDTAYLLVGNYIVTQGIKLTIPAGTNIYGHKQSAGALIVENGGLVYMFGRADNPITFTSNQEKPTKGDWGGIHIHGNAPNNIGANALSPYFSFTTYGGVTPVSGNGSGSLQYVRILYAGATFSQKQPMAALGLYSVDETTLIDYVQTHLNAGDGFWLNGGTVKVKHLVSTGNGGNGFVFSNSWIGKGQFLLFVQSQNNTNYGYYIYNNLQDKTKTSLVESGKYFTQTEIFNATLYGAAGSGIYCYKNGGMYAVKHIITNFRGYGIQAKDTEYPIGNVTLDNSIVYVNATNATAPSQDYLLVTSATGERITPNQVWNNSISQPDFTKVDPTISINGTTPDFRPTSITKSVAYTFVDNLLSPSNDIPPRYPNENTTFYDTKGGTYIGAFDATTNWIDRWTIWTKE